MRREEEDSSSGDRQMAHREEGGKRKGRLGPSRSVLRSTLHFSLRVLSLRHRACELRQERFIAHLSRDSSDTDKHTLMA